MKLDEAATAYVARFHESPPIVELPESLYDQAALLMQEAVGNDTKIATADFYAALGMKPPPPGVCT